MNIYTVSYKINSHKFILAQEHHPCLCLKQWQLNFTLDFSQELLMGIW